MAPRLGFSLDDKIPDGESTRLTILADNLGEFDQPSMVEDAPIPGHVAEDSGVMT